MLVVEVLAGLVFVCVLGLVFGAIERRYGVGPRTRFFARERLVDFTHFLVGNTVTKALGKIAFIPAFVFALIALHVKTDSQVFEWLLAHGPFHRLPLWLQVLTGLIVVDLFGWVAHWALHEVPDLWRLHAIHHSTSKLDWFSGVRNHPFAEMTTSVAVGCATLAMGIDPRALLIVTPILGVWGLIQHANVPWRFGWLGHIVVTPRFHRWHHATLAETAGKSVNLAGVLPIWDRVFGTYFMPDREPSAFGAPSENIPTGFVQQVIWSLR